MKRFKMTTCVVLAVLLVLMSTTAFAGTKYSNAVGLGTVLPKPTAASAPTEEPLPTEAPLLEPTEEPAVEPTEEPVVEPTEEPVVETTPAPEAPKAPAKEAVKEEVKEEVAEEVVEGPAALGDADVRLEANGLSEIFITLTEGTELVVLAVEGDWIKVDIDGQIGYIYKDSVQGLVTEQPELPEDGEEAAEPEEEMKVTIFSSRRTVMAPGEIIYLTCKLEGLDDYKLSFQWQYDRGNGFEDIPGATEDTYAFEASMETLNYDWSLLVYYE